jgi:hypothetical protein
MKEGKEKKDFYHFWTHLMDQYVKPNGDGIV